MQKITKEMIEAMTIHGLRTVLRELGGTPGSKNRSELVKDILSIEAGESVPVRGRPRGRRPKDANAYFNFNQEEGSDGVERENTPKSISPIDYSFRGRWDGNYIYTYGDLSVPLEFIFRDVESDEAIKMVIAGGVLEILDGYGFLRSYEENAKFCDFFVDRQVIKKYHLKDGDYLLGYADNRSKRGAFGICEVVKINGDNVFDFERGKPFEEGKAVYPDQKISFNLTDKDTRAIDLIAPIAKGSRALIIGGEKTGKSTLLRNLAAGISENETAKVIYFLISEIPESINEIANDLSNIEVIASTFDESPEKTINRIELYLERVKRLVECKQDVIVFLDSINKLIATYAENVTLKGDEQGEDALLYAFMRVKKIFSLGKKIKGGGSLTIIATCEDEPSKIGNSWVANQFKQAASCEIALDKEFATDRLFPALDIKKCLTRKEELLVSQTKLENLLELRRFLIVHESGLEAMYELIRRYETNDEVLLSLENWRKSLNS